MEPLCRVCCPSSGLRARTLSLSDSWYVLLGLYCLVFSQFCLSSDRVDPLHCQALLGKGRWLDDRFSNWQPAGMSLHGCAVPNLTRIRLYVVRIPEQRCLNVSRVKTSRVHWRLRHTTTVLSVCTLHRFHTTRRTPKR